MGLLNCWEIKKCERHEGGRNVKEFGVCIAAREGMGHSCWMIAGTLCGGAVQGTVAKKEKNCMGCEVYKLYHRQIGTQGHEIGVLFPAEQKKYIENLLNRKK